MLMPRILLWVVIPCICLTGADYDDNDSYVAYDDAIANLANNNHDKSTTPYDDDDDDDAMAKMANEPNYDHSARIQGIELMLEKNYTNKTLTIDIQKQLAQDIASVLHSIEITTSSQVPTTCATPTPPPTTTTTASTTTTTTTAPTTTTTSKPRPCGANKICVPFWNCNDNRNKYGNFIMNTSRSNLCDHYMQTCCDVSEIKAQKNLPCDLSNEDKRCGVVNDNGLCISVSNKLKGETEFGEFPWAVTIKVDAQVFDGALISESYVLTACSQIKTKENKTTWVTAGQWDRASEDKIIPYQQRRVKKVICDPEYNFENAENDLALLLLDRPFDLKPHIRPVCLSPKVDFDYNTCIVTGWNSWKQSDRLTLRRANAIFKCSKNNNRKKTKICVKIDDATLSYSNGSPLVCRMVNDNSMRYYLAGIWSYGADQIFFAKIAKSYERILKKIKQNEVENN